MLLELLIGTKYVGQVAEHVGYVVTSLELTNADTNCDIMNWNYNNMCMSQGISM